MLFINAPELVQQVMVEQVAAFDKGFAIHNALRPVVPNGLFSSEGDLHRHQRKLIAPLFTPRQIAFYADTITTYTEAWCTQWTAGTITDISQQMHQLTMSIIGKILFDVADFSAEDDLGAAIQIALEHIIYAILHFLPVPLWWPTAQNRRTRPAIRLIHRRMQAMIENQRRGSGSPDTLLSLLIQAQDTEGTAMTDAQIRDEALTLFVAGHDTTANALAWCFSLLTTHPAVYSQVQQELDSVLQGRTPTYIDLPRLPYTLQVIKETMRLYPPGWLLNRRSLCAQEVGGYQLAKGQLVMISIYTMHRRADYFPHPDQFDPARFTPEREKQLPRHAYMPFGAGPRVCVGNHLALMEAQLILATVLQRMDLSQIPGQHVVPEASMTLRQKQGCQVRVQPRNGV